MKPAITILALLCLTYCTSFSVHADEEKTPLGEEMSAMNKPYRSLSKAFRTPPNPDNQAEYIEMAETMLKHAKASLQFVPTRAQKLDAEAEAKMTAEYQVAIKASVQTIEQLIEALKSADYAAAIDRLNKLKKQKSDGHDKFQEEEEK